MAEGGQQSQSMARPAGIVTNRRDILRGATGLAAAALVGGAIADQNRVAFAAGPNSRIVGEIEGIGQFDVLSFSWAVSNDLNIGSQSSGAGAGKVHFQDLSLTKPLDSLTSTLFGAIGTGGPFNSASITYSDNKGNTILQIAMKLVLLTSFSIGSAGDGSAPTESLTLAFGQVTLT